MRFFDKLVSMKDDTCHFPRSNQLRPLHFVSTVLAIKLDNLSLANQCVLRMSKNACDLFENTFVLKIDCASATGKLTNKK